MEIGIYSPLVINLADVCIDGNQEFSLAIFPNNHFSFIVEDNQVVINFHTPLKPGQEYQIEINTGSKKATIPFKVRYPDLIFIGNANSNPQVWSFSLEDMQLCQITNIEGKVLEVSSAIHEQTIIFLLENKKGEREIWRMQPPGQSPELLYECGGRQCSEISCSPYGEWIAFSDVNNAVQLVILNSSGEIAYQLPYNAIDIHFSPNSRLVFFLDNTKNEIVVFDLLTGEVLAYPSAENLIGSIDENSEKILYGSLDFWGGFPVTAINELSIPSNESRQLFHGVDDQIEYFNPTHVPGSDFITISVRDKRAGNSTQLWLVDRSGDLVQKITQDYQFSHAALQWSPDRHYLAFQRLKISESKSKPQVAVWHKDRNAIMIVSEDAIQPQWLP